MSRNRGVVYTKPGEVQVQDIADPQVRARAASKIEHGVILKVVLTNICGSDRHMVRGSRNRPAGMVLDEITGEVIEKRLGCRDDRGGRSRFGAVQRRLWTLPHLPGIDTGVCLTVNPGRAGGAYGYVDMGGWIGGQARYVMVPYADFNLLKFPDRTRPCPRSWT